MSSGTSCPTNTAPLGRIRQAQALGLFFLTLELASLLCPTALATLPFYKCMPAAQSGPDKLGGCEGLANGRRVGAVTLGAGENCDPAILLGSPFPARGVGAGQTPLAA